MAIGVRVTMTMLHCRRKRAIVGKLLRRKPSQADTKHSRNYSRKYYEILRRKTNTTCSTKAGLRRISRKQHRVDSTPLAHPTRCSGSSRKLATKAMMTLNSSSEKPIRMRNLMLPNDESSRSIFFRDSQKLI